MAVKARVLKAKSKPRRKVARKAVRARVAARRPKASARRARGPDELQAQLARETRKAVRTPWVQWAVGVVFVGTLIPLIYNLIPNGPTRAPQNLADPVALEVDHELAGVSAKAPSERVAYWAQNLTPELVARLLSLPSRPSIQDLAPLIPASFDCTTFVETVMALARSSSSNEFYRRLLDLRYHGQGTGFFDRNHFPEADWIPNNVASGAVSDITTSVAQSAGIETKVESKRINRASWFHAQLQKGAFPGLGSVEPADSWRTPASVQLPYLPVDQVEQFAKHLPQGSIVNIVRSDNPKQWVLITHQAVVVREGGVAYLRHSTRDGRIHTTPLVSYLKSLGGGTWPIIGLNVVRVAAQP
jgi:hypothetical protein